MNLPPSSRLEISSCNRTTSFHHTPLLYWVPSAKRNPLFYGKKLDTNCVELFILLNTFSVFTIGEITTTFKLTIRPFSFNKITTTLRTTLINLFNLWLRFIYIIPDFFKFHTLITNTFIYLSYSSANTKYIANSYLSAKFTFI